MDLNFFKLCSGLKFLGYLMIFLVAGIVGVSYYVIVVLTWGPRLLHDGGFVAVLSFVVLLLFHLFSLVILNLRLRILLGRWSQFMQSCKNSTDLHWTTIVISSVPFVIYRTPDDLIRSTSGAGFVSFLRKFSKLDCHGVDFV